MEHLALHSDLELEQFCECLESIFSLPKFQYDSENETEWGQSYKGELSINVSRPFKEGTLTEWDNTVPQGCNFGITLNKHGIQLEEILEIGQLIANKFRETVFYHRTWEGPEKNIKREFEIKTNYNKR